MAFIKKIGNILKETSQKLPRLESSMPNTSFYQLVRCFSSAKLFIGGLSFATDDNSLRETFSPYGDVVEARIIFDRESGRSRGFGFVSYTSAEEASAAIQALDGRDLHGRFIRVAYAADQRRTSRGPSFSGAAGYGGSNYGDGGEYYPYGNTGSGSPGGGANLTIEDGLNVGTAGNFSTQDVSNGAGAGQYFYNAGENFEGNPAVGYGGAFGGGSGDDGHGPNGNFSESGYGYRSTDSYNATYREGHTSFNDMTQYNSASQDNGYWQNHRVHISSNFNDQDNLRGNMSNSEFDNEKYG